MATYVSTWMYAELSKDGGIYSQVNGTASDSQVQDIYWRCVVCFFHLAKRSFRGNPSVQLQLFTNLTSLPIVTVKYRSYIKEFKCSGYSSRLYISARRHSKGVV